MPEQQDLFEAPKPPKPKPVKLDGPLHDYPRPGSHFWRGFVGTPEEETQVVYSEDTEGECIRACREYCREYDESWFRVERVDYPAY